MTATTEGDPVADDLERLKAARSAPPAPAPTTHKVSGMTFTLLEATKDRSAGVYFIGQDREGNERAPMWLCAPLRILAETRGAKSDDWGKLLEWHDADGVAHRWAMPRVLLSADGLDVRRELMRLGLAMAPSRAARDLVSMYLQVWPVTERARCVERLGWFGGVYVLPEEAIGADHEQVVFQSAQALEPALSTLGTADGWRDTAAALSRGNSRMVFAICTALAPPLANICGEDSGGFHLRGASSSGKSTALALAASVWGSPSGYPRLWRTTSNGLEGLAALHNDGLLILDELSQVDPKDAGEAAYLLANGQGKVRATRTGAAKPSARWRLLFLSAGEESLSALMLKAGKKANAGQEIRLADIEADAGAGMGAFEVLNDQPTPAALALAIKDAAARHHGSVGVAWLHLVVARRAALADLIADGVRAFVDTHVPPGASGQVLRVARRFGLVATAGELATGYGLTGWAEGEASTAVGLCFASWLDGFGGIGNKEHRALLSQVRAFFEVHGASRFEDADAQNEQRVINRAGFYRTGSDGVRQFLVLPEVFKREVCAGHDAKAAAKVLTDAGVIQPGADGRQTRTFRLPNIPAARVYAFTAKLWEDAE
ncbi:DUF927 domain-containing protein [Sphaerotilus sp.]|uniref:DUF927 domain-containing protein n=1 Tax=Sphaerotilus sp. TaxID=2093942 RepID=UPI0034E2A9A3